MRFIYVIGKFLKIILYIAFVVYHYYAYLLHPNVSIYSYVFALLGE